MDTWGLWGLDPATAHRTAAQGVEPGMNLPKQLRKVDQAIEDHRRAGDHEKADYLTGIRAEMVADAEAGAPRPWSWYSPRFEEEFSDRTSSRRQGMGARGDLPELRYKYYGVHPFIGDHWLEAEHQGKTVGRLYWATDKHPEPGKITLVQVHPDYRRRGIATAMVDAARENVAPNIQFSSDVSPDGKAWSKANGYRPSDGWNDLQPRNDDAEWGSP